MKSSKPILALPAELMGRMFKDESPPEDIATPQVLEKC